MRTVYFILFLTCFSSCGRNFYIVRHAEKAAATQSMSKHDAGNPELSDVGKQRSFALRDRLSRKGITRIFTTRYKRTISTIVPVSERFDVPVSFYSASHDSLKAFVHKLKYETSGNILIVGHSNTVDDLVNELCGAAKLSGDLPENEFDNLFIVKKRGDRYKLVSRKYGASSANK